MRVFIRESDQIPEFPSAPATGHRLAGQHPEYEGPGKLRVGPEYLHGCRIVSRFTVPDEAAASARELLISINTYGDRGRGARCYFPGFGLTYGESAAAVDILVCLECNWVVFHSGGQSISLAPTVAGLKQLREIYRTLVQSQAPDAA